MFKRIAKKQQKREKEEELGLDEELKQVLGMQDTDSDESLDSESDSEASNGSDLESLSGEESDDDNEHAQNISLKRKRSAHVNSEGSSEDEGLSDLEDTEIGSAEDDTDDDARPPMGVMAATTDPLYDIPGTPESQDLRACVVCPGKLLKNTKMATVHVESNAHLRRLQRYVSHVSKLISSPEGLTIDDPREILRDMAGGVAATSKNPGQEVSSKRAQRRATWKAKKAERKKAQSEAKAKKSPDKGEEGIKPVEGQRENENKPKKLKKKVGDAEAKPVSITAHPASSQSTRHRSGREDEVERHDSDATIMSPPMKRRKQENHPDSPSPADSTSPPKKATPRSQGKAPKLKRHNTSLYFADDEKIPTPPARPRTQSTKTSREKEAKTVPVSLETKHRPSSRQDARDGSRRAQNSKRAGKETRSKGRPRVTNTNRGGAVAGGGRSK